MTETDCLAVLNELETEVITAAHNGNSVRLGKLGSFRPTISSRGALTAADAKVSNVKAVRFVKRDSHAKGNADGEEHA